MIDPEKAFELVLRNAEALETRTEKVKTSKTADRILSEDVTSKISSPPFNKAAMDGFAARSEDLEDLPVRLDVVGEVSAGQFPNFSVGEEECAEISTGAAVPEGADVVVIIENTERIGESKVEIQKPSTGNICIEGEDLEKGEVVLKKGQKLTPMRVGVAASAGRKRLSVHKKPDTAILCTGSEVREPGEEIERGQIYNANGPMLSGLLRSLSNELNYLGTVADDKDDLRDKIGQGLENDLLVISGGASVGKYDYVPKILEDLGVEKIFHKWAVKPGKPTFFGIKEKTIVFAMPGNPQSCFVVFKTLVEPAITRISGGEKLLPKFKMGRIAKSFADKSNRKHYIPCRIKTENGEDTIKKIQYSGSADIRNPSYADGFFAVPPEINQIEKGQIVEYFEI